MKSVAWAFAIATLANASTLTPPVLPLIVRNPYLSTWLQDARTSPWSRWPMHWTGEEIGFSVMAKAAGSDNVSPLLGRPHDSLGGSYNITFPKYLGATFDASTTNLSYIVPLQKPMYGVEVVLSFLSPITPTSTFRQAIPASYLTVHVQGNNNISIYIDVNGQWVSGDRGSRIKWNYQETSSKSTKTHTKMMKFEREHEALFTEINDRSEWGSLYFTAPTDVDHLIGVSAHARHQFAKTGKLNNTVDMMFRGIMEEEPIFAYAKTFDLSGKNATVRKDSATFTIAHIQDPVVQFAAERGLTLMRPLWKSYFSTNEALLDFHYNDFEDVKKLAGNYSDTLAKDAYASGSDDYKDIVELSARQVLGGTQFTGTPENPLIFLKEISSDGNTQTIDVIFPAFPFFLYTNPRWLAYLLEPLIEHMLSGQYPNTYAMHDLGASFPNATGHADGRDEYMPVEECGNILIMGLALVNSLVYDTGSAAIAAPLSDDLEYVSRPDQSVFALTNSLTYDGVRYIDEPWSGTRKGLKQAQAWVKRSYKLWDQWTGYLVEYSLEPANQLSTDDFAGWLALQTNLALKGIIGIKAMAGIAKVVNYDSDAERYDNIAREYISKWEKFGISRDGTHAKLAYDWYGSWTTLYNLYADALLCFHLDNSSSSSQTLSDQLQTPFTSSTSKKSGFVPQHIYKLQSDWYHAVRQRFGLPLDSRHLYAKSDWEIFAASVSSRSVRTEILQSMAYWVNETSTDRPLTDLYDTEGTGGYPGISFKARPVVGGHFAVLTLERACGGKAMDGLKFLDEDSSKEHLEKVAEAVRSLNAEKADL